MKLSSSTTQCSRKKLEKNSTKKKEEIGEKFN
jgi:hypothetical protein